MTEVFLRRSICVERVVLAGDRSVQGMNMTDRDRLGAAAILRNGA